MKNRIIFLIQRIFGFENYLFFIALYVYYRFKWDKAEKDFLKFFDMIPNEGVVLDIGANIGVMTAHFSRKLPKAEVISFEPVPYNLKTLKKVIRYFDLRNVTVLDFALGDKNGTTKIVMPIIGSAKKQGLAHIADVKEEEAAEEFQIEIKRLDDLPELKDRRITAIKIDVEGYEYFVLNGGLELIKKNRPVIYCELWAGEQRTKTFQLMRSLKYSVKVVENNDLVSFTNQDKENFFFVPE